jgi:hypothetical protein
MAKKKVSFLLYVYIYLSNDFLSRYSTAGQVSNVKYAVSLFENGNRVSGRDARFARFPWACKLSQSWSEEVFYKEEVDELIHYLNALSKSA